MTLVQAWQQWRLSRLGYMVSLCLITVANFGLIVVLIGLLPEPGDKLPYWLVISVAILLQLGLWATWLVATRARLRHARFALWPAWFTLVPGVGLMVSLWAALIKGRS